MPNSFTLKSVIEIVWIISLFFPYFVVIRTFYQAKRKEDEKAGEDLKNGDNVAFAIHNHTAAMYHIAMIGCSLLYIITVCAAYYVTK